MWGSVVGRDGPEGYDSRQDTHPNRTDAEYCAHLYKQYGIEFVEYLNGEFVILVYDAASGTVTLCTDRLGSRPVFYARTPDDGFVFSSRIQVLARHPDIKTGFDRYLHEYFAFERVLGTRTPLSGIEKLLPASKTRVDVSTGKSETTVYWRPEYRPLDRSYSYFVREFADRFERAVADRTQEDAEYGVLVSGGIDSRLIAAALGSPVTGYHMNEWENREARIAREVADVAGHDFEFLRRDQEYQNRALNRNPPYMSFISSFDQGQATNFRDTLAGDVDLFMSGLYSDVLYQHSYTPGRSIQIPFFDESISIPLARDPGGIEEYIDLLRNGHYTRPKKAIPSEYATNDVSLDTLLREEVRRTGDGIESHGVTYPGGLELVRCSYYYPITNAWSYFFHQSLVQMFPYRNPFLDTRLLDLQHRLPRKYHIRTNIVNDALCELDSDLAAIPHANAGIAPSHPFLVRHFGRYAYKFGQRYLGRQENPSEPHHTTGSWTDDNELIRTTEFVSEILDHHEQRIRKCEWLDWEAVQDTYRHHMDGEDNRAELFSLLTFLEMPIAGSLLNREVDAPRSR
ncbi:MAG: asparagine synthase [Euryarchaeota archaeon]|nr:asparagine synthase [Euryarchaeota archaeon]